MGVIRPLFLYFLNLFCCSGDYSQFLVAHTVKLPPPGIFPAALSEKKNWSTDMSLRVTSSYKICKLGCCPLFSVDAIYRGAMFSLSANWLRDNPFAFRAALIACPKALKSNFSLLCFIIISPNYIVYFISLSRYDYTHHSMDRNRTYIAYFYKLSMQGVDNIHRVIFFVLYFNYQRAKLTDTKPII